jgi:diguanylate cyclase (GGDEF)-like protein/PAS domain S-box-containing protein
MKKPTLHNILSPSVLTVAADTPLSDVLVSMESLRIDCVVAADESRTPLGIFTGRDGVRLLAERRIVDKMCMADVMSTPPITAPTDLDLHQACHLLSKHRLRHLIVVDHHGKLAGIVDEGALKQHVGAEHLLESHRPVDGGHQQMRLQGPMRQASDAILILHAESSSIVDCNIQACRSLDYTRDELLELTLFDIVPEITQGEHWHKRVRQLKTSGQHMIEARHTRRDGSSFPVEVNASLIKRDNQDYIVAIARDISLKKANHDALSAQRSMLQQIIDTAPLSICWKDRHGIYLGCNESYARRAALHDPDEIIGKTDYDLPWPRAEADAYRAEDNDVMSNDLPKHHVIEMQRMDDGSIHWQDASRVPLKDHDGKIFGVLSIYQDITTLKENQEKLEFMAHHDPLTKLPNRTLSEQRLAQELEHARRHGHALCVLFMDLDRFKAVNDTYGHPIGDELLCLVSRRLEDRLREGDTLGRMGGDEFMLVASPLQDKQDAAVIARDLIDELARPFSFSNGAVVHIGGSIGISLYPEDGESISDLIRNADAAMYMAKKNGRNQFSFYSPELNADAQDRLRLETELRRAVLNNELQLHFQSRIDMETGSICGAEALSRWQLPDGRWVPPASFIPLAEKSGVIMTIGNWVIEQACKQIRQWQDAGLPEVCVAVNISARQFHSAHFDKLVKNALEKYSTPPHLLELELTESMLMNEPENAIETMRRLKALGVKLSLDDFGTGYSNFSYLRRFPIDRLKIDQSFISGMTTRQEDAMIVDTIINLAHRMNLNVTGEGVETTEQMDYLREKHCNELQGYLFSHAIPPASFAELLRNGDALH